MSDNLDSSSKCGMFSVQQRRSAELNRSISRYGSMSIERIQIARTKVDGFVEAIINIGSLGRYNQNKSKLNISSAYHTFLIIHIEGDQILRLEKNSIVELKCVSKETIHSELQLMDVELGSNGEELTINSIMLRLERDFDLERIYIYESRDANCQVFCHDVLTSSGLINHEIEAFAVQDTTSLLEGMDKFRSVAKSITDFAHVCDKLFSDPRM